MATSKYKSPHDRALIAFGSDVLAILSDSPDWGAETLDEAANSARHFGLSVKDDNPARFRVIPRERFRNPLQL